MAPEPVTHIVPVIHIVDDDEAVRDSLGVLLSVEGLAVRGHASAQALLDAPPPGPGCVITDVHMAGISGLQLLRHLRARGVTLPVIVITGRPGGALAAEARAAGAAALVEKPFSPEEIITAVRAALQGTR
jgi:two-component system, LuxR family, response regulator FixJ